MAASYRVGVDIGGTFTDATLVNEATGETRICKVASTPSDPSKGFLNAAHRILREAGVSVNDVSYVVHGTTVATNAIIEGKTARAGFVTTEGFSDMLEIARQIRPSLYDLLFEKPRPLVPRHRCFGVPERLDAKGNVVTPLDEESVRKIAGELRVEGVESVAVCLLHSYANPAHERRIGDILHEMLPGVEISLSSELAPEIREYFRASTTVVNAAIRPVVSQYLEAIEGLLRGEGVAAELVVMQSNGGVFTFAAAREKPVFMVESGPAAGVIAASYLGDALGFDDVISFDMGGTTAKMGLIQDGTPYVTKDYEVGAAARTRHGAARGGGYPIRTPVIDLVEIGAGGGSIAWVDSGGALRVGPQSTGADPGPACYGKGGAEPTVTDANLVLGRLNPRYFLGGEVELDLELAQRAIQEKCAGLLRLDLVETAHGIVEIANLAMVNAMRLISVQRGYDPRDFALIAFGGAGPVHANRLAMEMEVPTTVVPSSPGTTSAWGLLASDIKHEYSATLIRPAQDADPDELGKSFRQLESEGHAALERDGIAPEEMSFQRQSDMRYVGQSYELAVPVISGEISRNTIGELIDRFHREHRRAYGFDAPDEPVQFVNLRVSAIGKILKPALGSVSSNATGVGQSREATRPVYFAEANGYVDCPIYNRYRLGNGDVVKGPAVVEEMDSTTVVHPQWQARVDRFGNLLMTASDGS